MSFKSFWKSSGDVKKSDAAPATEATKPSPTIDPSKDAMGPANKAAPKS